MLPAGALSVPDLDRLYRPLYRQIFSDLMPVQPVRALKLTPPSRFQIIVNILEARDLMGLQFFSITELKRNAPSEDVLPSSFVKVRGGKEKRGSPRHRRIARVRERERESGAAGSRHPNERCISGQCSATLTRGSCWHFQPSMTPLILRQMRLSQADGSRLKQRTAQVDNTANPLWNSRHFFHIDVAKGELDNTQMR